MQIILHNTSKIVELNGIPARIWEGKTDGGIPLHAYITRIAVDKEEDATHFESELDGSVSTPTPDVDAIPLRLLI